MKNIIILMFLCLAALFTQSCTQKFHSDQVNQKDLNDYTAQAVFAMLDTTMVEPVNETVKVASREACSYTCPNNFTVSVVPYTKSTCQCLTGTIVYTTASGLTSSNLVRATSGISQGVTGFNKICDGSDISLCLSSWHLGEPFCETECFSGLILVSTTNIGIIQYPFCTDVSEDICINLGHVSCCQSTNNNCDWVVNPDYDDNFVSCTPCGTQYNCTTH